MSIKHNGDLYTKAEMEALRKENDELKHALTEAELDRQILKKIGIGCLLTVSK